MIIEKTKSYSSNIKTDDGVIICSFDGDITEDSPLGNIMMHVYDMEKFKENFTKINEEYTKFKELVKREAWAFLSITSLSVVRKETLVNSESRRI